MVNPILSERFQRLGKIRGAVRDSRPAHIVADFSQDIAAGDSGNGVGEGVQHDIGVAIA